MAGDIGSGAPSRRYVPRGHPISWWMLLVTTGWIILLGWGILRNSSFPVLYAFLIDSVPDAASSGMGLMIGIALGVAATISASVAGIVIDNFGFAINYVVLAIPCLMALIPLAFMRETRVTGGEAAQE